jgi:hypothetical protein
MTPVTSSLPVSTTAARGRRVPPAFIRLLSANTPAFTAREEVDSLGRGRQEPNTASWYRVRRG